ncbi:hypothetical protein TNCV_3951021, partial [Trichonephila clavipes]
MGNRREGVAQGNNFLARLCFLGFAFIRRLRSALALDWGSEFIADINFTTRSTGGVGGCLATIALIASWCSLT